MKNVLLLIVANTEASKFVLKNCKDIKKIGNVAKSGMSYPH